MRICIFSRTMYRHRLYFPSSMVKLTALFSGMGHDVTVLTRGLPDDSGTIVAEGGGELHFLDGTFDQKAWPLYWKRSAERFDQLHHNHPFDLVIGRGDSPYGFFRYSRFAGQVPLIEHEGTYPQWLHQMETRESRVLNALRRPVALLWAMEKRQKRFCLRRATRVVCNSPALAQALVRANWWNPPVTTYLPYGFDVAPFAQTTAGTPFDAPPRLVFVGRLTWDKGIMEMIDILAQLKHRDVVFDAIGPVSDRIRAKLDQHAQAKGVADRFRMPGPIHHTLLPKTLAGATAFIFPSTHNEGLSKAISEAMAAGLPVVAYRLPGQDTLVDHGKTGWLERPRDVTALADRIDALLDDLPAARRMGMAGRVGIERDFMPDMIERQWDGLMQMVVAQHAMGSGVHISGSQPVAER